MNRVVVVDISRYANFCEHVVLIYCAIAGDVRFVGRFIFLSSPFLLRNVRTASAKLILTIDVVKAYAAFRLHCAISRAFT